MQDEFMTVGEAAESLGVNRTTVWRRIKSRGLQVFQLHADHRKRLVRRADIEALKRPVAINSEKQISPARR